jgi:hypothetical protein
MKTRCAGRLPAIGCAPVLTEIKAAPLWCSPIAGRRLSAAGFETGFWVGGGRGRLAFG